MVVATIGAGVPEEVLAAAGADVVPVLGKPGDPTDLADGYVEPMVGERARSQLQRVLDGTYAHVSIPASGSASIDLSGFAPLAPDSIVEGATLKVVHHEDPAIESLALEVRGSGGISKSFTSDPACGSSRLCISPGNPSDPTLRTDVFDITSLVLADPTLASLSLRFTATASSVISTTVVSPLFSTSAFT